MAKVVDSDTCYLVVTDINKYSMLQQTALELIMQVDEPVGLYGKPLSKNWSPMNVSWFYDPNERELPRPDIAAFGSVAFAASAETCEKLRPFIEDFVEFLPISVDGQSWFIIHVLAREDVFNQQLSKRDLNRRGEQQRTFTKLVLDGYRAKDGILFRVEGLGLAIYTTDRVGSLKHVVKRLKLSGLKFQELT